MPVVGDLLKPAKWRQQQPWGNGVGGSHTVGCYQHPPPIPQWTAGSKWRSPHTSCWWWCLDFWSGWVGRWDCCSLSFGSVPLSWLPPFPSFQLHSPQCCPALPNLPTGCSTVAQFLPLQLAPVSYSIALAHLPSSQLHPTADPLYFLSPLFQFSLLTICSSVALSPSLPPFCILNTVTSLFQVWTGD